jgi:hypothetical protein
MRQFLECAGSATVWLIVTTSLAHGQTTGQSRIYETFEACLAAGQLNREMCGNAFRNASAEFAQRAPMFKSREACESAVGRGACMISLGQAGAASKHSGITFAPRMSGVVITVASLRNATVVPHVAGRIVFSPRTILHADTERHPQMAIGGRDRPGQDVPADALPAGTVFDLNGQTDTNPNPSGPVATYPVPPARLKEMQERARSLGLTPPP